METLQDETVVVRAYRPDDVEGLYAAVRESIGELSPWMAWCTETFSRKESRDWVLSREAAWAEEEEFSFVIADPRDGRFLGAVGLNGINRVNNFANLGYWVRTSAAGHGFATAAARLVARWGIETRGFQRLEIVVATGNTASLRVAEKAGAVREGILRNRIRVHDAVWDAVVYSIVPRDLERT